MEQLGLVIDLSDSSDPKIKTFNANMHDMQGELDKSRSKFNEFEQKLTKMGDVFKSMVDKIFNLKNMLISLAGAAGLGLTAKSFFEAASATENYRIRLESLLGSVFEGNRLFKEMSEYASRVPFTYQQIMASATNLSGVLKGGVDQIKAWMPLVADLAAVSGLTLEQTTQQVIRMYSAGAGSADLFRERGVLAMMGFQAGVTYSTKETIEKMVGAWNDANSKFKGAADKLGQTWAGMISMIQDRWFQFRNMVMDAELFNTAKAGLDSLIKKIDELNKSGALEQFALNLADNLLYAIEVIAKTKIVAADFFDWVSSPSRWLEGGANIDFSKSSLLSWVDEAKGKISDRLAGLADEKTFSMLQEMGVGYEGLAAQAMGYTREVENQNKELSSINTSLIDNINKTNKALNALNEETLKLKLAAGSINAWDVFREEYEQKRKLVKDEAALNDWYYAYLGKLKNDEMKRQWEQDTIKKNMESALIAFKVKENEKYFKMMDDLLMSRLNAEKTFAEKSKELAMRTFDTELPRLNPFLDSSKISQLGNDINTAMFNLNAAQTKIINQEYIDQYKHIQQNIFDWEQAGTAIEKINIERNLKLNALDLDYAKEQEELIKKISKYWEDLSNTVSHTFSDAFSDILRQGRLDFEKLGKSINSIFTGVVSEMVRQKIFKPLSDQLMVGMSGIPIGNYYPQGYQGEIPKGGQTISPWAGYAGKAAPYIGAGMMAYGYGQANGTTGVGSGAGAMAGYYIGGPVLAGIGALVGNELEDMITNAFSKAKSENMVNVDIVFESINDQIMLVSQSWQGTTKTGELIDAIQGILEDQINFYNSLRGLTGQKYGIGAYEFKFSDTESAWAKTGAQYANAIPLETIFGEGFQDILKYGGESARQAINNLWARIFGNIPGIGEEISTPDIAAGHLTVKGIYAATHGWQDVAVGTYGPYSGVDENSVSSPITPEQMLNTLFGISDPEQRLQELKNWLGAKWVFYLESGFAEGGLSPLSFIESNDKEALDKFMSNLQQKFNTFSQFLAPGIGEGLNALFQTRQFESFTQTLRNSLAQSIFAGIQQGFVTEKLMPLLIEPFSEKTDTSGNVIRSSLVDTLNQYMSGNMNLGDAMLNIYGMSDDFNQAISRVNPLLETLTIAFDAVNTALGANTSAIDSNTKAILGPVESFLQSLDTGPLAPSQSVAGIMAAQNKMYTATLADPEQFAKYASYMTGTAIPFMQETTTDYAGYIAGIRSQVSGIPWYMNALNPVSTHTGLTVGEPVESPVMPYQEGGAGVSWAGSIASRGRALTGGAGGGILTDSDVNRLADALFVKFGGALMDVADAARADKKITGELDFKTSLATAVKGVLKNDPDARMLIRNA